MNLRLREKLLEKLIDDISMMDEGGEEEAAPEGLEGLEEAPKKIEVMSLEAKAGDDEEMLEDEEKPKMIPDMDGEPDSVVDAALEDEESLDEEGLTKEERLKKMMKG